MLAIQIKRNLTTLFGQLDDHVALLGTLVVVGSTLASLGFLLTDLI